MTLNSRIFPLAGVKNFRDMGGYSTRSGTPVAWRRLFRSGHLSDMTDDCGTELVARNITTVIDFRSDAEKKRHPVRWAQGWVPRYHPLPIGGNAAAWVHELFERLSASPFPADDLRAQFILAFETIPLKNTAGVRQFFDTLVDHEGDGAALFHCTAGKDRTGITGALLLRALGVGDEQVMEDFLLTNEAVDLDETSERLASWLSSRAGKTIAPRDVFPLVGVEPDFLHAAYAAIAKEYGSVDAYLENALGLTAKRAEKLRTSFLGG
ncbi:tyrosine-protein phosphatase [Kordiimonas aestuarii]|uniref:tyrosine-protein phosphatase n=1 Tax=Kordiimonas aestuarii TaxID=1005925 RepID=UPI0021D3293D|nr:tyrosine-protein phosphatase [Kordiimonas aestuarii]